MPNTRSPTSSPAASLSSRVDDARELEPGDVGGDAGRGRVAARALHQIGAVQARAVHPHEHLARARFGIRPRRRRRARRPRSSPLASAATYPHYRDAVTPGLRFMDDDGDEVVLDEPDALALLALLGDLDAATVSACPDCRGPRARRGRARRPARAVAPHPRAGELAISPTTHRRCTSSSSIGRAGAGTTLARPAGRRVARRRRFARAAGAALTISRRARRVRRTRYASRSSGRRCRSTAAGSMLMPMSSSSQ